MLHLHRYKIVPIFLLFAFFAQAQEINPLYDRKTVRFGFGLMGNSAKLKFTPKTNVILSDTLQQIQSLNYPGFGLGGLVTFRLAEYLDLRTMLNIQFAQRDMNYFFRSDVQKIAGIESTYMEIPLALKYKSKRHKNKRVYVHGGVTYRFDFTSDVETDRSDTKPIVALYPSTFSYDLGVGMDFYFEFFKFSPEIRVSNGLGNQLVPDGFIYAGSLDRVSPKLIQFCLLFQ
jgi:Outer membrane protein beta-barrel domain